MPDTDDRDTTLAAYKDAMGIVATVEYVDGLNRALEAAEANAAAMRGALMKLVSAVYCLRWEDRKPETELAIDAAKAALATDAGVRVLAVVEMERKP